MPRREPSTNVGYTCPDHTPRPQRALAERAPASYVGHHVKRAFPGRARHRGRWEHMWVLVQRVTEDGDLEGLLDNDPVYNVGYSAGDTVLVPLVMIEDVMEDER